ncbi:Glycosyltransferase [Candidatus Burkholderia verschuerenii]|uniref:Glycosyltransferase n=1 Tax=Candidatus Burkholderia verschuerenii TaxID=242163 RepID=A0A0L0MJ96_9BURK|nr:glycosyltransferase [Candidatus Burkholderia verschuerenii]KND62398.1 Glycosyltransferase [Candidatus Burkholderia verschuerenii]
MPKISVVVPTYNASRHIVETLRSLLQQDADFEILLLDDASKDDTLELARGLNDSRIRIFALEHNQGRASNANRAFSLCRGEYIARIDHDDIALPDRLSKQAAFLDAHPEITVLGTQIQHFGDDHTTSSFPLEDAEIKARFIIGAAYLANPSVMMRREFVERFGIRYDPNLDIVDDLGFWFECMLQGARFANLPEALTRYRVHQGMTSLNLNIARLNTAKARLFARIFQAYFPRLTGVDIERLCTLLENPLQPEPDLYVLMSLYRAAGVALSRIDQRWGVSAKELEYRMVDLLDRKWRASAQTIPRGDEEKFFCHRVIGNTLAELKDR